MASDFYLSISFPASSNADAEEATTAPYGGIAIGIIVGKFGAELMSRQADFLNAQETLNFAQMSENALAQQLQESRATFSSNDFETDWDHPDTGVSLGSKMSGGSIQQIVTVAWWIDVIALRERLTELGVLAQTEAAGDPSSGDEFLPADATPEQIVAYTLQRSYEDLRKKEVEEGNADASDEAAAEAPLPPTVTLPLELEPQVPHNPDDITQSMGFYEATHYVAYQKGVFLRSEPRVKKGTRLGKLPKNAAVYVIESGLGRRGAWSYIKVVDSPEEENFRDDQIDLPKPESDKKATYTVPDIILESKGLIGYVSSRKIVKFTNTVTNIFPMTPKEIVSLVDLPQKQKGKDKDAQLVDWAVKERCEIELIRDTASPWNSEYHLVWPVKRSFVNKKDNEIDEIEQERFHNIVLDERLHASEFILNYFLKYIEDDIEAENIKNSDRFCRLKKWTIDTTTKQGKLILLWAFPARFLDSIPTMDATKRRSTLDEEVALGLKQVPVMSSPTEPWTPDNFNVPYQKAVKYGDLKKALQDLKPIFQHYNSEESSASEIARDASARIGGSVVLFKEDEANPGEYQRMERFWAHLQQLMKASAIQWPSPNDSNNNNAAAAGECGTAASRSTPDDPHDESVINFGLNKDFSIRYVTYNGQPLRIGFNCHMTFEGLETNRWRLARTLNYLFYSSHIIQNKKQIPWTDWFKMYTFPMVSIVPQEDAEAQEDAELDQEAERSNENPAKTTSEAATESRSISDEKKRKSRERKAQTTSTSTLDSALVNIGKTKAVINDISDAYNFLFNKIGIDKLIVAIMRCIYLKNLTFEELLIQLGVTAFVEGATETVEKLTDLLDLLGQLPIECLVNVLADVAVFKVPIVPPGTPPGGSMTDEEAEAWLAELEAEEDMHAQAAMATAEKTGEQASSAEQVRLNQIKLHMFPTSAENAPSGSVNKGGDVKIWQEMLTNYKYEVSEDPADVYMTTAAAASEWTEGQSGHKDSSSQEFGEFTGWKTWLLFEQFNDVNDDLNVPTNNSGVVAPQLEKNIQQVTVGQWEKYTGLYAGQPQDPNAPLLNNTSPMMSDNKNGLTKEVTQWQTWLNAEFEEKFKQAYQSEGAFNPSWKGKSPWLLKVDGVFGTRTCTATKLALDRDHCIISVGDFEPAKQFAAENINANADVDSAALQITGSISGSAMNPLGASQPAGYDCPASPPSSEVKSCGELYALMRAKVLEGLRAARKGEDATEIDKEAAELQNQYYACMMSGNGRIAIGPGQTETTANEPTDEEIQLTVAQNQVIAEDTCGTVRDALLATLRGPNDPPDSEPAWPGDAAATEIQITAMNEYQQCLGQETAAKQASVSAAQSAANAPGTGQSSSVPTQYGYYPIPRNFDELANFIKKFNEPPISTWENEQKYALVQASFMHVEIKYPERLFPSILKHCKEFLQQILAWLEDKLPPQVVAIIGKMLQLLGPTINMLFTMEIPPVSLISMTDQFMDDPEKGFTEEVKAALKKIILEILIELVAALTAALQEACKLPAAEAADEPVKAGDAFRPPNLNNPDLAKALDKLNDLLDSLDWPGPREAPHRGADQSACPSILDLLDSIGSIISADQMCALLFGNPGPRLLDQIRDFIDENYPCDASSITNSNDDMSFFLSEVGKILKKSGSSYFDYCHNNAIQPPFRSAPVQILFDPSKCYDTTIYQKKLSAYLEVGNAFGLSEDDAKEAIDEEVRESLENLAKLAGLALDPSSGLSGALGADFENVNPCISNPELFKGLQSIKHALGELFDSTFDGIRMILAHDLEFVQQVFLDDGKTAAEEEEWNATARLTQEEIQKLHEEESGIMYEGDEEKQRPGHLMEEFRTKTTEKFFVKKLASAQAEKAKNVKKSAREASMEKKMSGKWDGGEYIAKHKNIEVEEDDLIIARKYYNAITETAGSIFYNPIADAVDININDESKLRYTLPDLTVLQDSFAIDIKRELGNFTFVDAKKIKVVIKDFVNNVLKPPAQFPSGERSPQAEVFHEMFERIMEASFEAPVSQQGPWGDLSDATEALFWLIQTYSIRKAMMFPTESDLFFKSEMMDLNLYPMAFNRADECKVPYSFTDQDYKDLCILNLEEIKENLLKEYEDDVEACDLMDPNNELSPLNELLAKGVLLALIRSYILENTLHAIFHLRLFKFEELISDEFAIDFIFQEMKTGLRRQQIYSLVKDFSKKIIQKRRERGERINAFNGRECLEFLYRENYLPMAKLLDSVIDSKREKIADFVLNRLVFEQPLDVIDPFILNKLDNSVTSVPSDQLKDYPGSPGMLHIVYPVYIPTVDEGAATAIATQATDAATALLSFMASGTEPNPADYMPDFTEYEEEMLIRKVRSGNFTPVASVFKTEGSDGDYGPTITAGEIYSVQTLDWETGGEYGQIKDKQLHGLRFMRPLDSFEGVPASIIANAKNQKVMDYQTNLSYAEMNLAFFSQQVGLNLPNSVYETINFLGTDLGEGSYQSDFDVSEFAEFIAYNSSSELSPVPTGAPDDGDLNALRDQYFNIDEKEKKGIKFARFSPKELKMKDIFKGGGFLLEKYIRIELKEGVELPPVLGKALNDTDSLPGMTRSIQSSLGYANIGRFQRVWERVGSNESTNIENWETTYNNKAFLDSPLGVYPAENGANAHITHAQRQEYVDENPDLDIIPLSKGKLRHWFKPIKFGLRVSYVLQGDAAMNEAKIKIITDFLDLHLSAEQSSTDFAGNRGRRGFRTAETVLRVEGDNPNNVTVVGPIDGLKTLVTYQLPIVEAEEDLFPPNAKQTIKENPGIEMERDFYHMTFEDLTAACKYLWPVSEFTDPVASIAASEVGQTLAGQVWIKEESLKHAGKTTYETVRTMTRALNVRVPTLKQKLLETPDFRTFFDYIIPIRRHVAFSLAHAIIWQKEEMNTGLFMGGTKEMLKKHLLTALNVDQSRYYQDAGHALVGGHGQMAVMNMRPDAAASIPSENPMWPIILKFLLKTPFLILKGLTEVFDPNISLSKKIYDGIVMGQEILKATVDPNWNVIKPPFVVISLGMLPSMLPYGVGFPPPPFGPGVGPPLTPFGAIYLAMGLHELPGFPSAKMKKPAPKVLPDKSNLSDECRKKAEEYENAEDTKAPRPHTIPEEDSDSDSKKIRSSFD